MLKSRSNRLLLPLYTFGTVLSLMRRKFSLKLVRELPIAGLFRDLKGTTRWEASGTDIVDGDELCMVFDSLDYVGYVSTAFDYRAYQRCLVAAYIGVFF